MTDIAKQYAQIQARVATAAGKIGKRPEDITIVAVSKTQPLSAIEAAIAIGIQDFGENKPQELRDKVAYFEQPLNWHMIGNLQRNKIKYVLGHCGLIHSVDSIKLLDSLEQECQKRGVKVEVLLQINVSREQSKAGFYPEQIDQVLALAATLKHVQVKGLMTIPPYVEDPEQNRQYFSALHQIFVDIKMKNIDNIAMDYLSMGMTGDFEVAIEEGATHIRVGTGIFGTRQ